MRCRLPLTAPQKGKAGDSNGIRAEEIKTCDDEAKGMIRQSFNECYDKKTAPQRHGEGLE